MEGGDPRFLLGTDNQGRDLVSVILFGLRISVVIGVGAVVFAAVVGVVLGLVAGFFGGVIDGIVMRVADVFVSFPPSSSRCSSAASPARSSAPKRCLPGRRWC